MSPTRVQVAHLRAIARAGGTACRRGTRTDVRGLNVKILAQLVHLGLVTKSTPFDANGFPLDGADYRLTPAGVAECSLLTARTS